ncbi:hypothetical protein BDV93DRAFT_561934 [Ceratobasidium sp. AG-I]|nr:hypothetical protein BDV93DRAFT_561934 [Ceratobasidium sp. AG-I]
MHQNLPVEEDGENIILENHNGESAPGGSMSSHSSRCGLAVLTSARTTSGSRSRHGSRSSHTLQGTSAPSPSPTQGKPTTLETPELERPPEIRLGADTFSYVVGDFRLHCVFKWASVNPSNVTRRSVKMNTLTKEGFIGT